MSWRSIQLVWAREIRDQLRDRRTLFVIAVLPLLLYPLMGMSMLQLNQFLHQHRTRVLVLGAEELETLSELPALFEDEQFAASLGGPQLAEQFELILDETSVDSSAASAGKETAERLAVAQESLQQGTYEIVVHFPPGFGKRLAEYHRELIASADQRVSSEAPSDKSALPDDLAPDIYYNSAHERSQIAHLRVSELLEQWALAIGRENLEASRIPPAAAKPFGFGKRDIATGQRRRAAIWSKILPLIVVMWALTGAFYPAIDLCAGEKERGTLETLLCCPAERVEIVWGKLLTVMLFSIATALLNLASIGLTAKFVFSQLETVTKVAQMGSLAAPPLVSILWLLIALIPISALFSALCLALAAFARSSKEGQYYLMPLVLAIMPLVIFPVAARFELNLGNSLIPVTGLVLLLQATIEGEYWEALRYVVPVTGVTLICCLMSIRWAVEQFSRESVLFRESERLELGRWAVHLLKDRTDTPSVAGAVVCAVLIFVTQFFVHLALASTTMGSVAAVVRVVLISQLVILLPALLLALLLTRRPLRTMLLERVPGVSAVAMAMLLAGLLHPWGHQLTLWIQTLYPIPPEVAASLEQLVRPLFESPHVLLPFLLVALLPAVCEEIAFRGVILSGFRHLGHKWWAIGLSAVLFGMAHTVMQQALAAAVIGIVIGYVAVQTGNLVPCIAFHASYNGLRLVAHRWLGVGDTELAEQPLLRLLVQRELTELGRAYSWPLLIACALAAMYVLLWFHRLPHQLTDEEALEAARDRKARETLLGEM